MGISVDGNSITVDNCTITINNAFDASTGVATITITPAGGLGTLPGLIEGQPGLPPIIQMGTTSTVTPGGSSHASLTLLSPGGPGVPSYYELDLGLPQGIAGELGSFLITGATDVIGAVSQWVTLLWDSADSAFKLGLPPLGVYNWPTVANSTTGTAAGPRTLAQVTIPAQNFAWYPIISGQTVVNGTANTQVNVYANIGSTSGAQVGVGFGVAGQPTQTVGISTGPPAGSASTYGQIASGSTATIIFSAQQVGSNSDAWSTSSSTTTFSVQSHPVLLT